jgi:outer membrane lipoprotein SlyB
MKFLIKHQVLTIFTFMMSLSLVGCAINHQSKNNVSCKETQAVQKIEEPKFSTSKPRGQ